MISPSDVEARLQTALVPSVLKSVGQAAEMAAASDQVSTNKMAFVVPGDEEAGPNQAGTGTIRQAVQSHFTVFTYFDVNDATGKKALNQAFVVREAVKDALVGWFPDGGNITSPMQYAGASVVVLDTKRGYLVYAINFFHIYQLRN